MASIEPAVQCYGCAPSMSRPYFDMNTHIYNTQGQLVSKNQIQEFSQNLFTLRSIEKTQNISSCSKQTYPCCNSLNTDIVSQKINLVNYYNPSCSTACKLLKE